jgi:hypothetical protein
MMSIDDMGSTPEFTDALLEAHDLSMSREPHKAAKGRLHKRIMPQVLEWLNEECDRRSDINDMIGAQLSLAVTMLVAGMAMGAADGMRLDKPIARLRESLLEAFDEDMAKLAERHAKGEL